MSTAFAYTRVSGKGQMEGHGLQRQHDAIRKFAASSGYQLTGVYSEEGSPEPRVSPADLPYREW